MDSYTTQRRLTHEFTNHIEALTLLLQQGEYEEAKTYLATVTKIIAAHTTIMNTHNPLLDALLSKNTRRPPARGSCSTSTCPTCGRSHSKRPTL